jgi:hypothetical protein
MWKRREIFKDTKQNPTQLGTDDRPEVYSYSTGGSPKLCDILPLVPTFCGPYEHTLVHAQLP